MTITYPRTLFTDRFERVLFTLQRRIATAQHGSGSFQAAELYDPLWYMELTTPPLKPSEFDAAEAWWLTMRGGQKRFLGYDPRRCNPRAYGKTGLPALRFDGDAFDGTALINANASSGTSLQIKDLPANFVFTVGDYIGWVNSGRRALHKVVEAATGNGSGVATVIMEPRISIPAAVNDVVSLVRPTCLMAVLPDSWQGARERRLNPISFKAIQVLS